MVIEIASKNPDPHDFQQAESRPVEKAAHRQQRRHFKNHDGNNDGRGGTGDGAKMSPHFKSRQQAEQNDDGQRSNERRKPPMAQRIISLLPSNSRTSSTRVF